MISAAITEALRRDGLSVALATPASRVCTWTEYTTEQVRSQTRLLELDVDLVTEKAVVNFDGEAVDLECIYTGRTSRRAAASLVVVTARTPSDELNQALTAEPAALRSAGIQSVTRTGDCLAPGTIAAAGFSAHALALDTPDPGDVPFQRERATV